MSVFFKIQDDVGFITFDQKDSKVNLLTSDVLMRLKNILDEVKKKTNLKALVFTSAKKDVFIAGADIREIESIDNAREGARKAQEGQNILNSIEDLSIPTIAVIDGAALGGGCELTLACDFRLATFNEKVKIGLPELNLGFVPGFGGTYRLPRLVGLMQGLKLILSGKPVSSDKALKMGLVDRLVAQNGSEENVLVFIEDVCDGKVSGNKYHRRRLKGIAAVLEDSLLVQWFIFNQSKKSVLKLTKGFYPAPFKAIDLIKETFFLNREKGLACESKAFGELAVTQISRNLIEVFYLSEKYKKLSVSNAKEVTALEIKKCAVLGAGVMGGGIAQLLSFKDIWIRLKDINYNAVALGFKSAARLYKGLVKKRKLNAAHAKVKMMHITGTLDYSGFKNVDLVIEAVVENMEIKKQVFKELGGVVGKDTILATNTSALSVTEMAKQTPDPSKVIGIHFFNPVHRMPLVEVITTDKTSVETIATTLALVKRLGKIPILVKDSCGFVVNRILLGYINEAGRILEECGDFPRIDKLATDFGMPMGPFALSDEVGLDVGIKVLHILEEGLGERFKAVKAYEKIFKEKLLGRKTGKGFYVYGKTSVPNGGVSTIVGKSVSTQFKSEEFLDRMIYIMINEAGRCLQEVIVDEPHAIDAGMIFGTGFPAFRGGLLRYADTIGIERVCNRLEGLANTLNAERFRPCDYLLNLKAQGRSFY